MNVTLWDTSSDVRKELSIQDDRTESDNRIEVMLLIGIAENNLPHIARWESTKPPYAEPHVRWCGRSVNVKIGGKCLLWLEFTSYPIVYSHPSESSCYALQAVPRGSRDGEPMNMRWATVAHEAGNECPNWGSQFGQYKMTFPDFSDFLFFLFV